MKKKGMEVPPEEGPAMIQQKDGTFKWIGSLCFRATRTTTKRSRSRFSAGIENTSDRYNY